MIMIIMVIIIIMIIMIMIIIIIIIDWRKDELRDIDRKTKKLFTMHRSMHPQSDADRRAGT